MTTTNENDLHSAKSTQKAVAWSLFASIILNLFLVVAVLAPLLLGPRPFGPAEMGRPHGDFMVDRMAMLLAPEDAEILKKSYSEQADALNKSRDEIRQSMDELSRLFESGTAEPKELEEAMKKSQSARNQMDQSLSKVLLDVYVKLSPEGRHRLSKMKRNHMMRDGAPPMDDRGAPPPPPRNP